MPTVPSRPERRRPRPGSLERPVNGRLYRGTWLLVGLPLLIAAFSVVRPAPLPPSQVPPAFSGTDARDLAADLVNASANRFPGSVAAVNWFVEQLRPYVLQTRKESFTAVIPGFGRRRLVNVVARVPGRSSQAILVVAHRDDLGTGPGAVDNASGTAALVELARAYSVPAGTQATHLTPAHTLLFLSTDGGSFGGLGAADFLAHSPERHDVVAVVNLDSIGAADRARVEIGGDTPRSASGTFLETVAARIAKQTGRGPARPSFLDQLIDLGFPYNLYEQAPFISRGIPAVTITSAGDRRPVATEDTTARLDANRLGQLGRATEDLLGTLDQGVEFAQGTATYVYLGSRLIRGWAIELVLMAMCLPFLAAAVDLFARCRRRRIPLAPALRSYRSRLGFWLWTAVVFEFFVLVGLWPGGAARPVATATRAATHWPATGTLLLGVLILAGWLVSRDRLLPRRPVTTEEELAGHTAALLALSATILLVIATNPFALLFVLPSAHAWLWLPNLRRASPWLRAAVIVIGFLGPAFILGSFAFRYGLGWHAPWYVLELRAVGYVSFAVVPITAAWCAGAAQLAALASGRYAPYPGVEERPRLGPGRRVLRRVVMDVRARRRTAEAKRQALQL